MGALPSRLRIHITLPLGTWCAIVVSCSSEFGTVVWYKEAPMPKHEIITKRPTLRMNDSHNELETKAALPAQVKPNRTPDKVRVKNEATKLVFW